MSIQLKVKEKSLAAEAKIIRQEELKAKKSARWCNERQLSEQAAHYEKDRLSLYEHRIDVVRFECRATSLARAYIKGTPYRAVEQKTHDSAYLMGKLKGRMHKLVCKYHNRQEPIESLDAWFEA